jgi:hypothetical protein
MKMSEAPTPTEGKEPAPAPAEALYGQDSTAAPGTETKPEGESTDALEGEKKGEETTSSSALELKLPEGVEVAQDVLDSFTSMAAEAGLNSETAQKLLDLHLSQLTSASELFETAQTQAFTDTIETWKGEIAKDPELGGANQAKVQEVLGKALDTYGSKEAREAFDQTGAGWNPAIVRTMYKMAQALAEGTSVIAPKPAITKLRGSAALYPETT